MNDFKKAQLARLEYFENLKNEFKNTWVADRMNFNEFCEMIYDYSSLISDAQNNLDLWKIYLKND